jgi:hypothetical protein
VSGGSLGHRQFRTNADTLYRHLHRLLFSVPDLIPECAIKEVQLSVGLPNASWLNICVGLQKAEDFQNVARMCTYHIRLSQAQALPPKELGVTSARNVRTAKSKISLPIASSVGFCRREMRSTGTGASGKQSGRNEKHRRIEIPKA